MGAAMIFIRTGLGVAVALALCGGAQAQMRGRVGPSVRVSTPVRARVVRVDRAQTTTGALTSDPTFFPGFGFGSTTISDVLNGGLRSEEHTSGTPVTDV